jgi:hypothetical protein
VEHLAFIFKTDNQTQEKPELSRQATELCFNLEDGRDTDVGNGGSLPLD